MKPVAVRRFLGESKKWCCRFLRSIGSACKRVAADARFHPSPALRLGMLILMGRTPARSLLSSMTDALDDLRLDVGRNAVAATFMASHMSYLHGIEEKSLTWRDVGRLSLATNQL